MKAKENQPKDLKKDQIKTDNVKGGKNTRPMVLEDMPLDGIAPISLNELNELSSQITQNSDGSNLGPKSKGTSNTKNQDRNAL